MARNYNQDYFKVGGTQMEDRDQARMSRAKLGHQASMLQYAREQEPFPLKKGKPAAKKQATASNKTARKEPKAAERPSPKPRRTEPKQPIAQVHAIHQVKPKHGKKRRSMKKRHEVDVIQELRASNLVALHEEASRG